MIVIENTSYAKYQEIDVKIISTNIDTRLYFPHLQHVNATHISLEQLTILANIPRVLSVNIYKDILSDNQQQHNIVIEVSGNERIECMIYIYHTYTALKINEPLIIIEPHFYNKINTYGILSDILYDKAIKWWLNVENQQTILELFGIYKNLVAIYIDNPIKNGIQCTDKIALVLCIKHKGFLHINEQNIPDIVNGMSTDIISCNDTIDLSYGKHNTIPSLATSSWMFHNEGIYIGKQLSVIMDNTSEITSSIGSIVTIDDNVYGITSFLPNIEFNKIQMVSPSTKSYKTLASVYKSTNEFLMDQQILSLPHNSHQIINKSNNFEYDNITYNINTTLVASLVGPLCKYNKSVLGTALYQSDNIVRIDQIYKSSPNFISIGAGNGCDKDISLFGCGFIHVKFASVIYENQIPFKKQSNDIQFGDSGSCVWRTNNNNTSLECVGVLWGSIINNKILLVSPIESLAIYYKFKL